MVHQCSGSDRLRGPDISGTLIAEIGPDQIIADVRAVLESAGESARTAIIGFCSGGRAAFTAATALPGLSAAVVFYGPGIASGRTPCWTGRARSKRRCSCTSGRMIRPSQPSRSQPSTRRCERRAYGSSSMSTPPPGTPSPATRGRTGTTPRPRAERGSGRIPFSLSTWGAIGRSVRECRTPLASSRARFPRAGAVSSRRNQPAPARSAR